MDFIALEIMLGTRKMNKNSERYVHIVRGPCFEVALTENALLSDQA